jgi:hypothetical protein
MFLCQKGGNLDDKNDQNFTPLAYGSQSLLSFLNLDKGVALNEHPANKIPGPNAKMFGKREEEKPHFSFAILNQKNSKKSLEAQGIEKKQPQSKSILEAYLPKNK